MYENNTYYIDQKLNLFDNKENIVGKFLIAFNIQKYLDEQSFIIKRNLLLLFIFFIIFALVLKFSFDYYINKIKSTNENLEKQNLKQDFDQLKINEKRNNNVLIDVSGKMKTIR